MKEFKALFLLLFLSLYFYQPSLSQTISDNIYSSYIGGPGTDYGNKIFVDNDGYAYVTGNTTSQTIFGDQIVNTIGSRGKSDVFLVKYTPNMQDIVFATLIGGSGTDEANGGVIVDDDKNIYISGFTDSKNFPVTKNVFDTTANGLMDAFVLKLDNQGKELVYSTYLGGSSNEYYPAIQLDKTGLATIVLRTHSANFPVTANAYDRSFNGGADLAILKLNADGSSLLYASYFGGSADDYAYKFYLDSNNTIYVPGYTLSANFPVSDRAYDLTHNGGKDAFVFKLNIEDNTLNYSTFLGGDKDEGSSAITVDSAGYVYVTGRTKSTNFPVTSDAYSKNNRGGDDVFVAKLSPNGDSVEFSTYVGGSNDEYTWSINLDELNNIWFSGMTLSKDYPKTLSGFGKPFVGDTEGYYSALSADGSRLVFSNFLGGNKAEVVNSTAFLNDKIYLVGYTNSSNLNSGTMQIDSTFGGGDWDGFAMLIYLDKFNYEPYLNKSIPDTSITVNESFVFKLDDSVFIDKNGNETLTISVKEQGRTDLPSWLSFDPDLKTFHCTPTDIGNVNIKVSATDEYAASVSDIFKLSIDDASSILENNTNDKVLTFPNPAFDRIFFESTTIDIRNSYYKIISVSGVSFQEGYLSSNSIDISELISGTYLLQLKVNTELFTNKIVVE